MIDNFDTLDGWSKTTSVWTPYTGTAGDVVVNDGIARATLTVPAGISLAAYTHLYQDVTLPVDTLHRMTARFKMSEDAILFPRIITQDGSSVIHELTPFDADIAGWYESAVTFDTGDCAEWRFSFMLKSCANDQEVSFEIDRLSLDALPFPRTVTISGLGDSQIGLSVLNGQDHHGMMWVATGHLDTHRKNSNETHIPSVSENSGWTVEALATQLDSVLANSPDVLVVCGGTNDASQLTSMDDFRDWTHDITFRAQAAGVRVVWLAIPPRCDAVDIAAYNVALRRMCTDMGARCVEAAPAIQAVANWQAELFALDGIHYNIKGHKVIGQVLGAAISEDLDRVAYNDLIAKYPEWRN